MAKPKYTTPQDQITFSIINEDVLDRLIRDGEITLPQRKLSIPKDEQWNAKQMTSKILQGIQNGDAIPDIASSLMQVIGNNTVSAVRNARTMVTSAENHGRLDSYQNLENQGVVQKKVWIATADDRTRESHLELDGEEVDINDRFSNGCMFPADESCGDPSEVWNCRCSMRDHIIGFRRADGTISYVNHDRDDTGHSAKIDEEKARRAVINPQGEKELPAEVKQEEAEERERFESEKIKGTMESADYEKYMDMLSNAENRDLYEKYTEEIKGITRTDNGGAFRSGSNTIEYSYEDKEGINQFSTLSHEYNHFFDYSIGRNENLHYTEIDLVNTRCQIGSGIIKPAREWASASDEFLGALRTDMQALKDKGLAECYAEFRVTTELRNATSGVQDALDGFFGTQRTFYGWGHGDRYYNDTFNRLIKSFNHQAELKDAYNELGFGLRNQTQAKEIFRQYRASSEAWANIGSAVTVGGKELEMMEKYMPNTVQAYRDIIGGLDYE